MCIMTVSVVECTSDHMDGRTQINQPRASRVFKNQEDSKIVFNCGEIQDIVDKGLLDELHVDYVGY